MIALQTNKKSPYPEVFGDADPPKTLNKSRRIKNILHLAGVGAESPDIMFVGPCALEEEINDRTSPSRLLKGPAANLFQRLLGQLGIDSSQYYYTTVVKYALEKGRKFKPRVEDVRWCSELLKNEVAEKSPKLVVCMGKPSFDFFMDFRSTFRNVQGGFFRSEEHDVDVYAMDMMTTPYFKPELINRFMVDLHAVKNYVDDIKGISKPKVECDYRTIDTVAGLSEVISEIYASESNILSVDCEWGGLTHVDGTLRSIQICWAAGKAAYMRFREVGGKWAFDEPMVDIFKLLAAFLNDQRFKFVGHNISADLVWMESHIGVDTYRRTAFDTMHAEFLMDEYADLKLERLSMKYTDLGRYDIDLFLCKKSLKLTKNEGYERIPDDVLIPYACKDVDVVMRAWPILMEKLYKQDLQDYYFNIALPYVSDGFAIMSDTGLPVNRQYLDAMREIFTDNEEILLVDLRMRVKSEANMILGTTLYKKDPVGGAAVFSALLAEEEARSVLEINALEDVILTVDQPPWESDKCLQAILKYYASRREWKFMDRSEFMKLRAQVQEHRSNALNLFKVFLGREEYAAHLDLFDHWWDANQFNIRSDVHKRRWLFDVKGLTPVKTTKKDGMQLPWEKVLNFPEEKQKTFSPATDKQTITILSEQCPLVTRVLELNSVGNIVKAFLKGPDKDGNEQGLHKWLQGDGRLHCNFACTETGRPRTWNPNVLNYPKAVTRPIEAAFKRLGQNKPFSLRSCVQAPEGWCLVDADLETAEVLGLAYISGDDEMIEVCSSGDKFFVKVDPDLCDKHGIPWSKFKGISSARLENLVSHEDCIILDDAGGYIRPLRDMHWEMAETMSGKPREVLDADIDRMSGKVGMFSIPYGASPNLLERTIEGITGIKPAEGTGDRLITAYETKFPVAAAFLKAQEYKVEDPGYYRSISGRVRHFHIHRVGDVDGLSKYARQSIIAPLTREARNYPMQEIVAATMARAINLMTDKIRAEGLQARPMILLHDALTVLCPMEERYRVKELMQECMSDETKWNVRGKTLDFAVDSEFTFRWGMKPTEDEKALLYSSDI
jgi:uracil-DNA glycosylase family 4